LLAAAWALLAPGGRLVYATCTLTRSENHDVVAAFLQGAADAALAPTESWGDWPGLGISDELGRQILPGEAGADGFYYAALNKQ
jgi:16S rRNA (cytosine967-C5)-methyltransferase